MESKIGRIHLRQDKDQSKQEQLKKDDAAAPPLHNFHPTCDDPIPLHIELSNKNSAFVAYGSGQHPPKFTEVSILPTRPLIVLKIPIHDSDPSELSASLERARIRKQGMN
jgi:hypothetical protein